MTDRLAEAGYPDASMEDVLSYVLFPDVALKFFESNRDMQQIVFASAI